MRLIWTTYGVEVWRRLVVLESRRDPCAHVIAYVCWVSGQ